MAYQIQNRLNRGRIVTITHVGQAKLVQEDSSFSQFKILFCTLGLELQKAINEKDKEEFDKARRNICSLLGNETMTSDEIKKAFTDFELDYTFKDLPDLDALKLKIKRPLKQRITTSLQRVKRSLKP